MEIGHTPPKLPVLDALIQQTASPEAQKLAKELGLSVGRNIPALVVGLASVSAAQRESILRPLLNTPTDPKNQNRVDALLNSPDLKLIKLAVEQRLVNTISALPLREGDNITVRIKANGQLQLAKALPAEVKHTAPSTELKPTANIAAPTNPKTTVNSLSVGRGEPLPTTKAAEKPIAAVTKRSSNAPKTDASAPPDHSQTTRRSSPLQTHNSLQNSVPRPLMSQHQNHLEAPQSTVSNQNPIPATRQTLATQASALQDAPLKLTVAQQRLLTAAIRNALPNAEAPTSLLKHLEPLIPIIRQSSMEQIQNSSLAKAVLTSLKLLQNTISIQRQPIQFEGLPDKIQQAIKNSGIFMEQKLLNAKLTPTNELEFDAKSLLSQIQTNVQQTLSALNSNQTSKTLNSLDQALLQLFSSKPGRSHESTPDDARKLTQQLLNTVQKNLSNIQLSQYKSIDRAHLEQTPIQNHFQVDIPLRLPEGLFNIFFQLREKKISEDEKEQTAKKKPRSRSRWSVYLELEMGNEGTMAVEMNLCEQDIDLQFWAEKPSLREKTLTELQQLKNSLEAQGLHVEDLRCSVKPPPKREMTFNASLIDIQT